MYDGLKSYRFKINFGSNQIKFGFILDWVNLGWVLYSKKYISFQKKNI